MRTRQLEPEDSPGWFGELDNRAENRTGKKSQHRRQQAKMVKSYRVKKLRTYASTSSIVDQNFFFFVGALVGIGGAGRLPLPAGLFTFPDALGRSALAFIQASAPATRTGDTAS
jgi:hypothetical protein